MPSAANRTDRPEHSVIATSLRSSSGLHPANYTSTVPEIGAVFERETYQNERCTRPKLVRTVVAATYCAGRAAVNALSVMDFVGQLGP